MSVYLDYQATTPCDRRVLEAMLPFFCEEFGNPHSKNHSFGWEAEEAIDIARANIAKIINADPSCIIFTSGATESNNLAIKGIAYFYYPKKNHIITAKTEHKCVLDSCRFLETQGFEVTYLPVQKDGLIDLDLLKSSIQSNTSLVSIMTVNNEIGVIQDISAIGKICREAGVFFHSDAAQAVGKIKIDVKDSNIDLLSISGHKIYGPKGIGALYVAKSPSRVRLRPMIHGGGQERGMRSGTLPTALCVGLGEACKICISEMPSEQSRITRLRDLFWSKITEKLDKVYINGHETKRIPGNLNVSFACVEGESLMGKMPSICVASGSACTSSSLEPSYVLKALGVEEELAHTSLRIGIGRWTTEQEIEIAADKIINSVEYLRSISPLWDMELEGIDLKSIIWSE
jgi:cysteine desulfurase